MADTSVVKFVAQVADDPLTTTEIYAPEAKVKADIKRGLWVGVVIWRISPEGAEKIYDGL